MAANLVSAKVSVFYSKIAKIFPKSSQWFYLAQTLIKSIKPHLNRGQMNYLLLNIIKNQETKIKLGCLPQALSFKTPSQAFRSQCCSHERQELKHKESIVQYVINTSKSNILPMHRHLIGKQIIKARKNQHMQGREKKQQQSQHNER